MIKNYGFLSATDRDAFKNEIAQLSGVKAVTASNGALPSQFSTSRVSVRGSSSEQQVNFIGVDYNFLEVMGIRVKEGRGFSRNFPSDTLNNGIPGGPLDQTIGSIILNETAVRDLAVPAPAVGKQILWGTDRDTSYYVTIVGVVKDFHFTSLRNEIKPFAFFANPRPQGTMEIKLSGSNIPSTLAQIQHKWKQVSPERAIDYTFLDETFGRLYQAEHRFQKVFISLVLLGILIACMGLLGLATFAAQQRIKEIGIRKVLGASIGSIVQLLSRDFLKLVGMAFLLALPIGWYASHKWLQDFAYRIKVEWWVFVLAGSIAVTIAFLTISLQTIKAALSNPVKNLRTE